MWTNVFYLIVCFCIIEVPAGQSRSPSNFIKGKQNEPGSNKHPRPLWTAVKKQSLRQKKEKDYERCWLTLNVKEHYNVMKALEKQFRSARKEYDKQQYYDKFDEEILGTLLADRGATHRETQKHGNLKGLIPSGLNLGGHSMMRMTDSIMFFHRMKLRNDTIFRVNYLSSNFSIMTMTARLALNDLHLIGNYERVQTTSDSPSTLYYTPSYGEVEILLRDVLYKIEGRYRLQKDRLILEMILSELYIPYDGILMTYRNSNSTIRGEQMTLQTKHISGFLDRMKSDLDSWLKDFFNEFLLDHPPKDVPSQATFLKYDKERVIILNRYVDEVIRYLTSRLEELHVESVKLPNFSIYTFNGFVLEMSDGTLAGLETMYRRSMATNSKEKGVRKVDALIAFSSLKVRYSYEVRATTGSPPLYGSLILSGDELSAIMSLRLVKNPPFVDLKFDFIKQLKPESLTVEGSVAGVIANFKHLLELHIIAIMTNAMVDQVKELKSLVECVPTLLSTKLDSDDEMDDDNNDGNDRNKLSNKKKAKGKKKMKNGMNLNIRASTRPGRKRPTKRVTAVDDEEGDDDHIEESVTNAVEEEDEATTIDDITVDNDNEATTTGTLDEDVTADKVDVEDQLTTIQQSF